jgi:mono/diheme cytochrome c family protein
MKRRVVIWSILTLLAMAALTTALVTQTRRARTRTPVFLTANPAQGEAVFQSKGCARCHAINGRGGKVGPDLGRTWAAQRGLPQLVTAMWNHAPEMWARMHADGMKYPSLKYDEAAALLAYLYLTRFVDGPGDPAHGRKLFEEKSCARCHTIGAGARVGPDLAKGAAISSIAWTQSMWNHAWAMQDKMQRAEIAWPNFQDNELRDLLAYVRAARGVAAADDVAAGDPEHGWVVFQQKACNACHSIREDDGSDIPNLGPRGHLPPTYVQFGGAMLNHSPVMRRVMQQRGITHPEFRDQEMADVAAFLYSLSYSDPDGSPHVGKSVFAWRGCGRCHGNDAQGSANAPGLRGRGEAYTAVGLAASLWEHGERMYRRSEEMGIGWPTLTTGDVGDILSYLNAPLQPSLAKR